MRRNDRTALLRSCAVAGCVVTNFIPIVCSNGLLYIAMRCPALLLTLFAVAVCFSQEPVRVKVNLVSVSFSVFPSRRRRHELQTLDWEWS